MERITPSVYHSTSAAHYLTESHYQMFDGLITRCTAQHRYEVTSCLTREGSSVNNNIEQCLIQEQSCAAVLALCFHEQGSLITDIDKFYLKLQLDQNLQNLINTIKKKAMHQHSMFECVSVIWPVLCM